MRKVKFFEKPQAGYFQRPEGHYAPHPRIEYSDQRGKWTQACSSVMHGKQGEMIKQSNNSDTVSDDITKKFLVSIEQANNKRGVAKTAQKFLSSVDYSNDDKGVASYEVQRESLSKIMEMSR